MDIINQAMYRRQYGIPYLLKYGLISERVDDQSVAWIKLTTHGELYLRAILTKKKLMELYLKNRIDYESMIKLADFVGGTNEKIS